MLFDINAVMFAVAMTTASTDARPIAQQLGLGEADLYDAAGARIGWLRAGRPVLELDAGSVKLGDVIAYYDAEGAQLGALTFTGETTAD